MYTGEGVRRVDGCMGQMRQRIEKSVVNRHTPRSAPKFVSGSPPKVALCSASARELVAVDGFSRCSLPGL